LDFHNIILYVRSEVYEKMLLQRASRTSLQELMLLHVSLNTDMFCTLANITNTNPFNLLRKPKFPLY
jgi:hypothetical protein